MAYRSSSDDDNVILGGGLLIIFIIWIIFLVGSHLIYGIGSFGPTKTITITINTKHIDTGKDSSHYMLTSTDGQSFEVDNGWFLGVWNSDELYGSLKENHTYNITTKGDRVVGWYFQDYPYVISVQEVKTEK